MEFMRSLHFRVWGTERLFMLPGDVEVGELVTQWKHTPGF